eukprot:13018940-Alexandrium_andersonii.AAC.1
MATMVPPSSEAQRLHALTHEPHAAWCPVCVAARGKAGPHVRRAEPAGEEPEIHADYLFLTEKGKESETATELKVLVMVDRRSGAILPVLCSQKGPKDAFVVRSAVEWLARLSYLACC